MSAMRGPEADGRASTTSGRRRLRAAIQEPRESADGDVRGGTSSEDGVKSFIPP